MQIREVMVGDCVQTLKRKHKIKKSEYLPTGTVPVIDQSGQFIAGYINDRNRAYDGELPVLVFGDHTCVLKYVDFPFAIGADGTQLIRPRKDFDIRYFYYALRNLPLDQFGYQRHFKYLKTSTVSCPPMYVQRRIAAVLGTYDDLIENNTRRIKILEEMAATIYREWFVEFRFPGHENVKMVESELGLIPQGWEVKKVKQLVKRLKTGQIYTQTDVEDTGKVIVADQSRADILGFHDKEPDHHATPKNPIVTFGDHTCKMQLMITPFSLGPNVVPFIARDEMPIIYLFLQVSNLVETREYKRHWTDLNNKEVVVADSQTRKQFSDVLIPTFQLIEVLNQENRNLRNTRDMLLPKLISGELDVSDLEIGTDLYRSQEGEKSYAALTYSKLDRPNRH